MELAHIQSLVLIAGLSGAGKSHALDAFEDAGFYALDNLPVALLEQFLALSATHPGKYHKTALQLDIDSRDTLALLTAFLEKLGPAASKVKIVFLDAKTESIIKRYSETRRPHPGFDPNKDKSLEETIQRERSRLTEVRERASFIVDTSTTTVHDLRRELLAYIDSLPAASNRALRVNFLSFGFKYGIPIDCDLVVDVRFLPNPHFIDELREKTGLDAAVSDYVLQSTHAQEFLKHYCALIEFLLPRYAYEGKSYLNIGIGCTGGKHRSVALACALAQRISSPQCLISVKHRDHQKQ
jgi:UPF0042 nucleotide-binding protein